MDDETDLAGATADAAPDHIAEVEALAELDRIGGGLFLEAAEHGVQPELAEAHQIEDQHLGQASGEHLVRLTCRKALERQDHDRRPALLHDRTPFHGIDRRRLALQQQEHENAQRGDPTESEYQGSQTARRGAGRAGGLAIACASRPTLNTCA